MWNFGEAIAEQNDPHYIKVLLYLKKVIRMNDTSLLKSAEERDIFFQNKLVLEENYVTLYNCCPSVYTSDDAGYYIHEREYVCLSLCIYWTHVISSMLWKKAD